MSKQRIIVIAGGSSGLGLRLAEDLSKQGYRVYASFNSTKPTAREKNLTFLRLDVREDQSCLEFVKSIEKREGKVDILINCAGLSQTGETLTYASSDFVNILQVNLVGAFRLIKLVVPLQSKGGAIINITSMNGFVSFPHSGLYSASKFGLEALGYSLRGELSSQKIKVVNVAPGFFVKEEIKNDRSPILRKLLPYTTQKQVSSEIVKLIEEGEFPARLIVGFDAKFMYLLVKILPFSLIDKIIDYLWNRKGTLALRK